MHKIPKGIPTQIVRDKKLLRLYAVYLDISGLTKNRCIHNFQRRKLSYLIKDKSRDPVCLGAMNSKMFSTIRDNPKNKRHLFYREGKAFIKPANAVEYKRYKSML